MKNRKEILVKIFGFGMGDVLTSTPAIRKLYNIYSSKISICSKYPNLFQNNPYIKNNFRLDDAIDESMFEIFSLFERDSFTTSNKIASVRKHHACCTQRSCAYDLGFDLTNEEL
jgi:hypothetical protein